MGWFNHQPVIGAVIWQSFDIFFQIYWLFFVYIIYANMDLHVRGAVKFSLPTQPDNKTG